MFETSYVGHVGEPVVVIEDFHPDFDQLRAAANGADYGRLGPHYPGLQAPADPRHLQPVGALLTQIFQEIFGVRAGVSLIQCTYSVVTVPDADLAPIQSLPHVDTTDPGRIALLHYLSGEETGGTAFYRHRATGTETLNTAGLPEYTAAIEAEGVPQPGYMRGSDTRFEQIGHIAAKSNRAVLYRSHLLHSGVIPKDLPFSDNPETARLTLNSFFQSKDQIGV